MLEKGCIDATQRPSWGHLPHPDHRFHASSVCIQFQGHDQVNSQRSLLGDPGMPVLAADLTTTSNFDYFLPRSWPRKTQNPWTLHYCWIARWRYLLTGAGADGAEVGLTD